MASRRDYELAAEIAANLREPVVTEAFVSFFRASPGNFDEGRFRRAAGTSNYRARRGVSQYGDNPGKFDNILDNALYLLSLDGTDESAGDSSEGQGWYGLMLKVTYDDLRPSPEVRRYMKANDFDFPLHVIIHERTDGIVEVDYFDSDKEAEDEWEDIEDGMAYEEGDEG